ncbi:MAG TPA: DNA alkylation repair protein [Sporichthya sp.]|nr:DNA alkylation repair protein [Sporichthya sp.]
MPSRRTDTPAAEIVRLLRAAGDPVRAEQERRYLKSTREHAGVTVPGVRRIAKQIGPLDHDQLIRVVEDLWAGPFYECCAAAVELLELNVGSLGAGDLPLLERLIRESGTWALVDNLAASVVGALVERQPKLNRTLDRWATDPDFWVRRSALLALLGPLRRGGGDFEQFGRYADAMLTEKEFFIRKAIGWVLRDTSRTRPDLVFDWLLPRAGRASGVTTREAVKYLTADQRARILARRSAVPPRDHSPMPAPGKKGSVRIRVPVSRA